MKPTRSSLKNKLDRVCSRITRSIGQCQMCGSDDYEKLQDCHIYSRTYLSVRWDLKNRVCLCAGCHFYTHKNPIEFTKFVYTYLGEYEMNQLTLRKESQAHFKLHDLQKLYDTLVKLEASLYAGNSDTSAS